MTKRPTSISVIAWILIVIGGIGLISTTGTIMINSPMLRDIMSKSPIPIPIQYVISYFGILIGIISGVAMLKGKNWARWLYITWNLINFVIGITISPMKAAMIPSVVLFLIVTFFLFRPKANEFFSLAKETVDA